VVPEIVEGSKAYLKIVGIDGDIIVVVFAGLSPNECRDTPIAASPVTHSHIIQGIENLDDFGNEHAGRLEPGRAHHYRISAHQHLARTAANDCVFQPADGRWTLNPVRDHPPTEVAQLTCGATIPQRWLHLAASSLDRIHLGVVGHRA
jgi:hypothetical protein